MLRKASGLHMRFGNEGLGLRSLCRTECPSLPPGFWTCRVHPTTRAERSNLDSARPRKWRFAKGSATSHTDGRSEGCASCRECAWYPWTGRSWDMVADVILGPGSRPQSRVDSHRRCSSRNPCLAEHQLETPSLASVRLALRMHGPTSCTQGSHATKWSPVRRSPDGVLHPKKSASGRRTLSKGP